MSESATLDMLKFTPLSFTFFLGIYAVAAAIGYQYGLKSNAQTDKEKKDRARTASAVMWASLAVLLAVTTMAKGTHSVSDFAASGVLLLVAIATYLNTP